MSGITGVRTYTSRVLEGAGVQHAYIPYTVVLLNLASVLITGVAVLIIDIVGRRQLLLIPMCILCLAYVGLTVTVRINELYKHSPGGGSHHVVVLAMSSLSITFIAICIIAFGIGLGPIPAIITSELFRERPRGKAVMLAGWFMWGSKIVVIMTYVFLLEAIGSYTFLLSAVFIGVSVVFIYFLLPETRNKTFDEIAQQLGSPRVFTDEVKQKNDTHVVH